MSALSMSQSAMTLRRDEALRVSGKWSRPMYVVKWRRGTSKGYDDHIPKEWVSIEGFSATREHAIRGPKGWFMIARCSVKVTGPRVTFQYGGKHRAWNTGQDFFIGEMRFEFSSTERVGKPQVLWKLEGEKSFDDSIAYVEESVSAEDLGGKFEEGRKKLKSHFEAERHPLLRSEKLMQVLKEKGKITCEACHMQTSERYGHRGIAAYEVHHRKPIRAGERITYLADLAVLCANCHRVIHEDDNVQTVEALSKSIRV